MLQTKTITWYLQGIKMTSTLTLFRSPDHRYKQSLSNLENCLNLWSAKWLKPSLILVSSSKPSKFWVEEILFGLGLINFSIRFLNTWHEEELRILISMLFHSVITSLLNYVPFVPTCLTCLCALRAYVPTCLKLLRAYVPTCLKLLRAYMPTCLKLLRAYVPTYLELLRAYVPTYPHFSRAYVLTCVYIFFIPTCL